MEKMLRLDSPVANCEIGPSVSEFGDPNVAHPCPIRLHFDSLGCHKCYHVIH